jgi:CheY-like chemotaxis protein/MinD-like ATPase involved in chromosome partitioning or flagellar assembly
MARILVIDDDASLLQMMSLMLKRAGHQPILANDGHEGIETARDQHPDLAVVDVMMPDLNGYEVCRILREDPDTADIPLLVLTALSQHEQRDLAEEAGADEFVTKPITRDDLVNRVEELLETGPRNYPAQPQEAAEMADVDYAYGNYESEATPPPGFGPADTASAARADARATMPRTRPLSEPYHPPESYLEQRPPAPLPLVAVMGLNLGVGATTLAVNLGRVMAYSGRTCVVDLQTQSGQVAVQLKMVPPRATWLDLINLEPGADKRLIGSALMMDHEAGLGVLAAPLYPVEERLNIDTLDYVLSVLSEGFHHIVVDLPPILSAMNIAALRRAEHILLVVGDDPANLITISDALANIERLNLPGTVSIVLNRTRPHGVSFDNVMEIVNRPLAANIPYEPAQVQALTAGEPLVVSRPETLFARTVAQLARQF